MLSELQVKNFAIIDDLQVSFQNGFNVISGETGAGKSILLKSLSLLMGAKANTDWIRPGCQYASIEGLFDLRQRPDILSKLEEMGIETEDKSLVVKRLISAQSKSKIYLNSSLSTLSDLASIVSPLVELTSKSAPLIELTGQHESKSLLSKSYHLHTLDRFGMCAKARNEYEKNYNHYENLKSKLEAVKSESEKKDLELDFLIYQREEIRSLNLQEDEEESLTSNFNQIKYAKKIQDNLSNLEALIWNDDSGALVKLQIAQQNLNKLTELDASTFNEKANILKQAIDLVDEFSYQVQSYSQNIDFSDMDIQDIENRLSQLRKLQKKYGPSIKDILSHLESVEEQIHQIENHDEIIQQLEEDLEKTQTDLEVSAKKLSKMRKNVATLLMNSVNEELEDLNMKGLTFHVDIHAKAFSKNGIDDIEFMCKTGKNTQARSLAKTASGGELSRILLALKNVIGASEISRTYLFDEVDTGVSGETAEKVGRKLRQIANGQQVICITHLPQVASFANNHYYIEKNVAGKLTKMQVTKLKKQERIEEIARLISGEKITKTSLAHAKELIQENSHAL